MFSNIYEEPNVTMNVIYSKGDREQRRIDIYESAEPFTQRRVDPSTQGGGTHIFVESI